MLALTLVWTMAWMDTAPPPVWHVLPPPHMPAPVYPQTPLPPQIANPGHGAPQAYPADAPQFRIPMPKD